MEAAKFVIRSEEIRQRALLTILELPTVDGDGPYLPFEVVIRPHKRDRSLEQNARVWALHNAAAKHTGEDVDVLHHIACKSYLGVRVIERKGVDNFVNSWEIVNTTTNFYDPETMTTRKLNVAEMGDFMTKLERTYISMGVPTGVSE